MAKSKKQKVEEVSRKEINGNIYIFYSDGSVEIVPASMRGLFEKFAELITAIFHSSLNRMNPFA